jgi:hypothetical protein
MLRGCRLVPTYGHASKRLYSSSSGEGFNVLSFLSRVEKLYDTDSGRNKLKAVPLSGPVQSARSDRRTANNRAPRRDGALADNSKFNGRERKEPRNESWNRRVTNLTSRRTDSVNGKTSEKGSISRTTGTVKRDTQSRWAKHNEDIESMIITGHERLDLHISTAKPSSTSYLSRQHPRGSMVRARDLSSKKDGSRFRTAGGQRRPDNRRDTSSKRRMFRRSPNGNGKEERRNGLSALHALAKLRNIANANNGFAKVESYTVADMVSRLPSSAITYNTRVLSAVQKIKLIKEIRNSKLKQIIGQNIVGVDESTIAPDSDGLSSISLANTLNSNSSLSKESRLLIVDAVSGKKPLSELRAHQ